MYDVVETAPRGEHDKLQHNGLALILLDNGADVNARGGRLVLLYGLF